MMNTTNGSSVLAVNLPLTIPATLSRPLVLVIDDQLPNPQPSDL